MKQGKMTDPGERESGNLTGAGGTTGVGENGNSEGRPNRNEQKAVTGGEPARFPGPTAGG